jgi:hypothetical protein
MKKYLYILIALVIATSCSEDFLEETPVGELTDEQVTTAANVEAIVISAYSVLNGQYTTSSNAYNSPASNWSFGDVVSDDAYKGGGGTGDQNQIHLMEIYAHDASITDVEAKWECLYEGINRANLAIRLINETDDMDDDTKEQRIAEMRFLRGHYHFEAKKIYGNICWVDETVEDTEDYYAISNTDLTDDEQWTKIEEDFEAAYETLPETQDEVGRPTKMAALSYLAKCYVFEEKWSAANDACDEVIGSGDYSLEENFSDVFLPENDNGSEIIFAVQQSIDDGTTSDYSGSIGDRLMAPGGDYYANYGFLRPSQNLVNAYRTTDEGLPTFDNVDVTDDDNVDPRLDHTLARPGIPYLDLGAYDWTPRSSTVYGMYSPKKRMVSANSEYYSSSWPYVNALNYYIIRYADVLLWKAEAEIQLGELETGRQYINMIRTRAKNSEYVQNVDETGDAANYLINTYSSFSDQDEAMQALEMERRLEFAHEGHRFFDLVRWGIAADVINTYLETEKTFRSHLTNAEFVEGKNEYQPIPQTQIDLCTGDMEQNDGY